MSHLETQDNIQKDLPQTLMPLLFLGHGSPNEFTEGWRNIGKTIPKPESEKPETIHDFGGFPTILYKVQYPAPGNQFLAEQIIKTGANANIRPDVNRGLDHGCWSVLRHMYPAADIPIVQMSIDLLQPPQYHYDLGKTLSSLRSQLFQWLLLK